MKKISMTTWVFIAMFAGVFLGIVAPDVAKNLSPISNIFLRLIKSIIAPLLFGTLVYGIAGAGTPKAMGRIGAKAFAYFIPATTVALFVGLVAVNLTQPGAGLKIDMSAKLDPALQANKITVAGMLEHTFPSSIIEAMAKGEVLQIVVFSVMFGIACSMIGLKAKPMVDFCHSLSEVMFQYTGFVMYLAPFGVLAAMASTVGTKGIGVLTSLGKLVLTLYGALFFFVIFVLGFVAIVIRLPIKKFWNAVKEPYFLAFSTASSEAALPLALENMEKFGVPKHIVSFVLPTGYSFNLDGSTLYLSLASVFVAQAAGVNMSIGDQIMMMLTLMLSSKGVAAVPRASLVILAGTLSNFNLPIEGISLILGVDALMDMARTSVNLLGNCLAAAVVAKWEGYDLNGPVVEPATV